MQGKIRNIQPSGGLCAGSFFVVQRFRNRSMLVKVRLLFSEI